MGCHYCRPTCIDRSVKVSLTLGIIPQVKLITCLSPEINVSSLSSYDLWYCRLSSLLRLLGRNAYFKAFDSCHSSQRALFKNRKNKNLLLCGT